VKEIEMSQQSFSGLSAAEFQQNFDSFAPAGWRPIQIQGFGQGNESRFNVIWEQRDGPEWVMHHDMTQADFGARNQDLSFGGFHIVLESTWAVNGQPRFWAMWEK
jgi:hypothetical protein